MNEAFKAYFDQIKNLDIKDSTEHTLRPALHNLLIALAAQKNSKIRVIPEPKRDESGKGAPDVKFKIGESILGYLENKKTDANLDQTLKSDQIAKYKKLSDNLILTNYLEWIWLKEGKVIGRETLAHARDVGYRKAHLDLDNAEKVGKLIENFLSMPPKGIAQVKDLALALATRCHDLREFLTEELIRQEKKHQEGRLFGLFNVFKKDVFHELSLAGFADAFAQMLGYGLFLARLNSNGKSPITLTNAKQYIPANFELIRELVNFLDELDKPEYSRIKWLVEEILSIMNALDLASKQKDILVITGNPPYSGHSLNKGEWISRQIETYKYVDGKPLGERILNGYKTITLNSYVLPNGKWIRLMKELLASSPTILFLIIQPFAVCRV